MLLPWSELSQLLLGVFMSLAPNVDDLRWKGCSPHSGGEFEESHIKGGVGGR